MGRSLLQFNITLLTQHCTWSGQSSVVIYLVWIPHGIAIVSLYIQVSHLCLPDFAPSQAGV